MKDAFTGIQYPIGIDKGLGRLAAEEDYEEHVVQMIRQVLMTSPGERVNRPDFGCGLRQMIFAPNSDVSANMTQVMVYQSLEKWLGGVIEVSNVKVEAKEEVLHVHIAYLLKARQQRRYLNLEVSL